MITVGHLILCFYIKKEPLQIQRFRCWQKPIVPGRHQPSIVGASELNFRVRDGNGWTLAAINTNYHCTALLDSLVIITQFSNKRKHFLKKIYKNELNTIYSR